MYMSKIFRGIFSEVILNLLQDLPRLLDAPSLKSKHAKLVSCGARHSAVLTGMIFGHLRVQYTTRIPGLKYRGSYFGICLCFLKRTANYSAGDGTSTAR